MTWDEIGGWMDFCPLYDAALKHAFQLSSIPEIVEVGCYMGKSTAYMATKIKESGRPVKFWAIDNWAGAPLDDMDKAYQQMEAEGKAGYYRFMENMKACGVDHLIKPWQYLSVEAANGFDDQVLDFCFIDADHSYDSVKADINAWAPKVKPGGWLAGHDFNRPDVARAVWEAFATDVIAVGPQRPETGNLTCWLFEIPK